MEFQRLLPHLVPNGTMRLIRPYLSTESILPVGLGMLLIPFLTRLLKHVISWLQFKFDDFLFPTAYISAEDDAFKWIMAWLAQDPEAQRQMHHFQLTTADISNGRNAKNKLVSGMTTTATWTTSTVIGQILPTYGKTIAIHHEGSSIWINRHSGKFARSSLHNKDHFRIRTYAFQNNALRAFLVAAHDALHAKQEKEIHIFHPKRINPNWQLPVSRPHRPWSSVLLPGNIKEHMLKDMKAFFSDKEMKWYGARGIPHRRGYLFHGSPGAGKTTLTTALASKLSLDIYAINPGQRGMDDAKLNKLLRDCAPRSIILIEDIDCVFGRDGVKDRLMVEDEEGNVVPPLDSIRGDQQGQSSAHLTPMLGGSHDLAPSTVSLAGLLNAIDGVSSQEGCILIASTNHLERLDPALSRAGRFDVKVSFANAMPTQARALFQHFYPLGEYPTGQVVNDIDDKVVDDLSIKVENPASPYSTTEKSKVCMTSQPQLDSLADTFVHGVFPIGRSDAVGGNEGLEVSMAALQAYLLQFKDDPSSAAEHAAQWAKSDEVAHWQRQASSAMQGFGSLPGPREAPVTPSSALLPRFQVNGFKKSKLGHRVNDSKLKIEAVKAVLPAGSASEDG
ncbi:P-loop containing nucleoside triphosphate hydrolase protein [Kockovaella imperatae]|uniref:p-loop containing nucleoside triphosphate hydrolase protein n=1 Tax=Kockovaella imperatae TaxID=4999 RepID=A0A1Y1UR73_9TREE|nr:P-loop containing nucleoside triphosphate hydrolase protein [Kockovaella imperatae]ORX39974.1 P-loop containing nucleoside triphosphate hydrolase protein [Kockovaella imperatae]